MLSEIVLMLSQNHINCDSETKAAMNLVPDLVVNGMVSFLFDLRQAIFEQTASSHDVAVESEVNIAQTLARIFIQTNPLLINDS
mmetsp:Transcript_10405/g.17466  ORF Transcript_10405/g.17466 Transcript_10405/m.17466 type:complete len:84 (+) Transcript_10405:1933-2184(+)